MQVFHFDDIVVLSPEEIKSVLNKIDDIPTLPMVAAKLLKTVNDPNFDVKELSNIISMDQAVMAKLLRVANSAFYAGNSEVKTIDQAVMRLGVSQVRSIVVGVSVIKSFAQFKQFDFDVNNFWKHCLATAFLNKIIADMLELDVAEDVWVCGIIHDIGKLVYAAYMPTVLTRLLNEVKEKKISFFQAEKSLLKIDHTQIGRWLCEKWNIPKTIKEVALNHHEPPINEFMLGKITNYIAVTHISDSIVKLSKIGNSGDYCSKLENQIWNYLDKSKFDTKSLLGRIKGFKKEIEEVFETLKT
ncbi:MAG: hypothetical protein C0601_07605 [Candidatus Muiribacterium halophilum]|uniref:HDOD domain-containing protein n=1 Tax=Muiribacterium halophilum TaxID=2053465 RepID=A0A2N5ZFF2_MUIH1|nr:MAG: hypothetical protein C0601_07605 [Candidatus Muirbacterium halophilum]